MKVELPPETARNFEPGELDRLLEEGERGPWHEREAARVELGKRLEIDRKTLP